MSGQVTDTDGKPLADAIVRVVIPAADPRQFQMRSNYREIWGTTDSSGKYSVTIARIENETSTAIDILHPGHRRLVGTLMMGGDPNEVSLSPGGHAVFDAKLPESLFFAGQVADEAGNPVKGVHVSSNFNTEQSSAGIERSDTDDEGRFAVYSYDPKLLGEPIKGHEDWGAATASIPFHDDRYVNARLAKLEELDPAKRDTLRVVMNRGLAIDGTAKAVDGTVVSDVPISIYQVKPFQTKVVRTDRDGRFKFIGLHPSDSKLRVVDVTGKRKSIQSIELKSNQLDMIVSLEPIESPTTSTHQVLGMTLTDVTEELDNACDLNSRKKGVMVVDPGNRIEGFDIGEVRAGDVFWMVGNEKVDDIRSMVTQLAKEAKSPTVPPGAHGNLSAAIDPDGGAMVRVVFTYNDDRGHVSNTQYMKLTPLDIAELEKVLETL